MKRRMAVILLGALCLCVLFACSGAQENTDNSTVSQSAEPAQIEEKAAPPKETEAAVTANEDIIDLTQLSSTMVYAEVYNITVNPEDYLGKTIKMRGLYYSDYYAELDNQYHYVMILDATACCPEGFEFIWSGGRSYPDDYPDVETEIEVTGVFESYEEEGFTYYYIATDGITVL